MSHSETDSGVHRISVSLPRKVFQGLDQLVVDRGFESRSQAIAEMIDHSLAEYYVDMGDEIMAGTITLVYDEAKPGLLQQLADIQREYVAEVITSHHVLLESSHTLEVVLVQGPAKRLRIIADQLITRKGVKSGRLTITSSLLPPIHAPEGSEADRANEEAVSVS